MNSKKPLDNDLEYNDGLGDLLREREKIEFSWIKTGIVGGLVLILILVAITLIMNYGRLAIEKKGLETQVADLRTIPPTATDTKEPLEPTTNTEAASPPEVMKEVIDDEGVEDITEQTNVTKAKPVTSTSTTQTKLEPVKKEPVKIQAVKTLPVKTESPKVTESSTVKSSKIVSIEKSAPSVSTSVKPIESSSKYDAPVKTFKVIAGTFESSRLAKEQAAILTSLKFDSAIFAIKRDNVFYYRVQVGAFSTKSKALLQQSDLSKYKIDSFITYE